jgi:hypothetical protein
MHPDEAAQLADMNLRRQHKFRDRWNRYDQADENMWRLHDSELGLNGQRLVHGMPYGICTVCEHLRSWL